MTHITYKIVRHEDGWAYTVNGAASSASAEQRQPGNTEAIEFEDESGKWHSEVALGSDRPDTDVEDSA